MEKNNEVIQETTETPPKKRKRHYKKQKSERRGRIIIRNLPFKATEEKLQEHFKEFGNITEVNILKRYDGKLVGCAFVQYDIVQSAAKAIHHRSGKEFLGRPIVCDWAVGKNTYIKKQETEIKEEPIEIKEEKDIIDIKVENDAEESAEESESEKSENDDETDETDESDDSDEDDKESVKEEPEKKRPKFVSNDVNEGKTIFIKNIPFQATNDDLHECMLQFGPMFYALVCVDPVTEHSKGSGFVKYKSAEDAEKCLQAGTELTLMGNILDCHKAMSKNDLENKKPKQEKQRDSRNLYLVKEGVILAGSQAAVTVSAADMAKRLQIERWKTQMLRNLNMFVSKYRIVIHNLPATYDDTKLRTLLQKYAGSTCMIKECRVMRNMKVLDSKGQGQSKEYGFVAFGNHEDALKMLRSLNNNPKVFSESKRPIVAFSIENKAVINARNKRIEKSKLNNPTYLKKHPEIEKEKQNNKKKGKETNIPETEFMGTTAKQGDTKLRSKMKLQTQATIHRENMKNRKKELKKKQTKNTKKDNFIRQPQQKKNTKNRKPEDDNFSKLVNKYKTNLTVNSNKNKLKKWYE